MKVRIVSRGEYDRYEDEVRFVAMVGKTPISVTITAHGLFIISEALEMSACEPLIAYAASGRLLELVVEGAIEAIGPLQPTYLITHHDVLRITGVQDGFPHVPKRWNAAR